MIYPPSASRPSRSLLPVKVDRLVVGIVAGAALVYLAGKYFGLGKSATRSNTARPGKKD